MKKKPKSSVRRPKATRPIEHIDAIAQRCSALSTLGELLELCAEQRDGAIVGAKTVGNTGSLLLREVERLRESLQKLEQAIKP